jgi:tetratricopeptide (TPR) repeat protein
MRCGEFVSAVLLVGLLAACWPSKPGHTEAARELKMIEEALTDACSGLYKTHSLEGSLVKFSEIRSRLDVFEPRFGWLPDKVKGWDTIQQKAKELLPEIKRLSEEGIYYNKESAGTIYCFLLDLSGQPEQALAELMSYQPSSHCQRWNATVYMSRARQISGIYQRMGRYADALEAQEAAVGCTLAALYRPREDILCARHAFLLYKTDKMEEAALAYIRVTHLFPGTEGYEVARAFLTRQDAWREPTADLIADVYLEGDSQYFTELAISALAKHKFPESFEILAGRFKSADEWERNRLIRALGELGDKRAIPILKAIVTTSDDVANGLHALVSLHALGDQAPVVPCLETIRTHGDEMALRMADRTLRNVCGGGPAINPNQGTEANLFADAWLEWLASNE